jgi:hypothetical protein
MQEIVEGVRINDAPRRRRGALASTCLAVAVLLALAPLGAEEPRRWNDAELVASYAELEASGRLSAAILRPSLPSEAPERTFLDALAWFAAGTPAGAGELTLAQLDAFLGGQAQIYGHLLEAKVARGEENDYPRTRTWKVIQKLTLLRDEMSSAGRGGAYRFPATARAAEGEDPWEREHTLSSPEEFDRKVCRASFERPVLVKFGNTNCTQCMLFEMIGSIKELAVSPGYSGKVDVYKVWFGMRPDASFAGKIRDPERLEQLAAAEGIRSSPSFVVYRNGRRHVCGSAFPDAAGADAHLDACLAAASPASPATGVCAPTTGASS